MKIHELKIKSEYWEAIYRDDKTCEIRKNDRDFQVGDKIKFFADDSLVPNLYLITHVLHFQEGLKENYVALSIKKLNHEITQ